jgi:hypothetical protein
MGSEHDFPANARDSLIEIDAFFFHAAAYRFEHRESAVSLIQVQDGRSDAHRAQCAEASYAKQQFLTNSNAAVAAIQARSKFAVLRRISFDVRIEQEQRDASHFYVPDLRADQSTPRLNFYSYWLALGPNCRLHGHLADVGLKIFFLLPAILIQALAEISLSVKKTYAHKWNPQIGGALDVIAGENAQTARIYRERFMQTKFGGEIGYRTRTQNSRVPRSPRAVRLEIFPLAAVCVVDAAVQNEFARSSFNSSQRNLAEKSYGIVIELPPAQRIKVMEDAR